MIIKIDKDNDDITDYLEIDYENINKEDSLSTYETEPIYILHFPNAEGQKPFISYGNGI